MVTLLGILGLLFVVAAVVDIRARQRRVRIRVPDADV
jgi:hypothetical protein